jgi:hypothetical protein
MPEARTDVPPAGDRLLRAASVDAPPAAFGPSA